MATNAVKFTDRLIYPERELLTAWAKQGLKQSLSEGYALCQRMILPKSMDHLLRDCYANPLGASLLACSMVALTILMIGGAATGGVTPGVIGTTMILVGGGALLFTTARIIKCITLDDPTSKKQAVDLLVHRLVMTGIFMGVALLALSGASSPATACGLALGGLLGGGHLLSHLINTYVVSRFSSMQKVNEEAGKAAVGETHLYPALMLNALARKEGEISKKPRRLLGAYAGLVVAQINAKLWGRNGVADLLELLESKKGEGTHEQRRNYAETLELVNAIKDKHFSNAQLKFLSSSAREAYNNLPLSLMRRFVDLFGLKPPESEAG